MKGHYSTHTNMYLNLKRNQLRNWISVSNVNRNQKFPVLVGNWGTKAIVRRFRWLSRLGNNGLELHSIRQLLPATPCLCLSNSLTPIWLCAAFFHLTLSFSQVILAPYYPNILRGLTSMVLTLWDHEEPKKVMKFGKFVAKAGISIFNIGKFYKGRSHFSKRVCPFHSFTCKQKPKSSKNINVCC